MELFGLGLVALLALSWYWIGAVIVTFIVFASFANDENTGSEVLLFMAMVIGLGYLIWGQLTITAAVFGIFYYLVAGAVWSLGNYSRIIRKEMKWDKDHKTVKSLRHYQNLIHKSKIIRWIAYWPFSILNFIIGDFIFEIFNHIAEYLRNTYKNITNFFYKRMFGDLDPDTGKPSVKNKDEV